MIDFLREKFLLDKMATYVTGKVLVKSQKPSVPNLDEIQDGLECVICLSIPKSNPVYQCDNGHIFCDSCHYKVIECCTCGVKVGNTRNRAAEKFLEKCPTLCDFSSFGCSIRLARAEMEEHKSVCLYKPVPCPATTCNDLLSMEDVIQHMDGVHGKNKISLGPYNGFPMDWHAFSATYRDVHEQINNQLSSEIVPGRFKLDGLSFFGMLWRSYGPEGKWMAWIYIAATIEDSQQYVYTVKVKNANFDEKLSYTGQTASLQLTRGEICNNGRCLKFDDEIAKRFSEDNELTFIFRVRRKSFFETKIKKSM